MITSHHFKLRFANAVLGHAIFAFTRKFWVVERVDIYLALDTIFVFNLIFNLSMLETYSTL
jgi:hypothetical protein